MQSSSGVVSTQRILLLQRPTGLLQIKRKKKKEIRELTLWGVGGGGNKKKIKRKIPTLIPLASYKGLPGTSRWQNKNFTPRVVGADRHLPLDGRGAWLGARRRPARLLGRSLAEN